MVQLSPAWPNQNFNDLTKGDGQVLFACGPTFQSQHVVDAFIHALPGLGLSKEQVTFFSDSPEQKKEIENRGFQFVHVPAGARHNKGTQDLTDARKHHMAQFHRWARDARLVYMGKYLIYVEPDVAKDLEGRLFNTHHAALRPLPGNDPSHIFKGRRTLRAAIESTASCTAATTFAAIDELDANGNIIVDCTFKIIRPPRMLNESDPSYLERCLEANIPFMKRAEVTATLLTLDALIRGAVTFTSLPLGDHGERQYHAHVTYPTGLLDIARISSLVFTSPQHEGDDTDTDVIPHDRGPVIY